MLSSSGNSWTREELHPTSVSQLRYRLISLAEPQPFLQGNDVRRLAQTLAWTRGITVGDTIERAFGYLPLDFHSHYLHIPHSAPPG